NEVAVGPAARDVPTAVDATALASADRDESLGGELRARVIAACDSRSAHEDLPGKSVRYQRAGSACQDHEEVCERLADGAVPQGHRVVVHLEEGDVHGRLRDAVHVDELRTGQSVSP